MLARKKLALVLCLICSVTVILLWVYESLRYKGQLEISVEAKVTQPYLVDVYLDLYNPDWRCPLSAFSVNIYDNDYSIISVEVKEPVLMEARVDRSDKYPSFAANMPDHFVLGPHERRMILLSVKLDPEKYLPHLLKGHLRMTGATGDQLILGQSSASFFSVKIDL